MKDTNARLSAAFVLVAAFATTSVGAQPAGSPSGMAKAQKAGPHALKANEKAEHAAARADDKRDKLDAKGAASAEPKADGGPTPADSAAPLENAKKNKYRGRGFRALGIDFQHGAVTKAELQDRIKAMHAARLERKKEHREELRARWGPALNHPSIRQELRHHARREAFLSRMMFVAETEVADKKKKEALILRIEKLIDKENERHERAMERLKSNPAAPASASAAAPVASVPAAASANLPKPAHSASQEGAK